jgi:hypothetical protein
MALVCLAMLLLINAICAAQSKLTAQPDPFDPAKSKSIVLSIKKDDGSIDSDTVKGVIKVTVGDKTVAFQRDDTKGTITITDPPANLTGQQTVKLFGSTDNLLGQVPLTYPSGSGSDANPTQTPTPPRESQFEMWSRILIGIAFLIVLGAFVYTIAKSILRSRATFRSPLGMPVGSFRAIIAYTLVGFLGFYVLNSILTGSEFKLPEALLGIVATVIGFYFGTRSGEEGGVDERAGIVRGIVRKDTPGSGAPVSGAQVKFKRDDGTEPYSRITDVDGRFALQGAKAGKYKVSATANGSSGQLELTITEGSDQEIEIIIKSVTAAGPGGTTGSLKGTVKQPDGNTAVGATITLKGNKTFTAKSGDGGSYIIDEVEAGQYTAVASSPDFAPSKPVGGVTVAAGEAKSLDLKLEPKP